MVILKKLKSATLLEVLVATVLVVIIFVVASLVLNNLLLNSFAKRDHDIEYKFNELEYKLENGVISLPYSEVYEEWRLQIKEVENNQNQILFFAQKGTTDKQIKRIKIVN